MSLNYPSYLDQLIVEIADRQRGGKIHAVNVRKIHEEKFPDSPFSWFCSAPAELNRRGLGVDCQDTANETFLPNGALFARAAEIRAGKRIQINWTKWGAIAAILAIPTMIAIWWFT